MKLDVRKTGYWMVGVGAGAMTIGLVADAVRTADDPSIASREGIFELSGAPHALFFGGLAVAVVGVLAVLFGRALYGSGEVTTGRRLLQVGAPVAAVLLVAGCATAAGSSTFAEPSADDPAEADAASTEGTDEHAMSHDETGAMSHDETGEMSHDETGGDTAVASSGEDNGHGQVISGTATGDSPCETASPTPASPGQVGAGQAGSEGAEEEPGHGDRGMVVQTALTKAERVQLEQQMVLARTVVDKFPTVKAAEAGGYHMSTVYVPCIGAHYTNYGLVPKFDPTAPSELLYDGSTPDAEIVGLSYLVFNPGGPPEGFAGKNDHWHQHNANGGLCFGKSGVVIGGEDQTREECKARGGTKRELTDIWMMHAWVVPGFECSWGVFAGECPELGGKVGGTAWE